MRTRTISITIPTDAEAGDTLTFSVENTELEICVPEGTQPGDVLQVQVAIEADEISQEAHGKEESQTEIKLGNETILKFSFSLPSEDLQKTDGDKKIAREAKNDGTHALIWSAARHCIDRVFSSKEILAKVHPNGIFPTRVLELGSGLGALGISYAMLLAETKKAKVVLSDCHASMPLLEYNINLNREKLPPTVDLECKVLDWTERKILRSDEKFDMIIGSDLLYNVELLTDLADTVFEHLEESGKILLSVRWRKPEEERAFFQSTHDRGIQWSLLSTPSDCDLNWNEFGNPNHEASNRYLQQRSIAVNGEILPVAAIDESCMEKMSDEEHDAFEKSFLQVYVGNKVKKLLKRKRDNK